MEQMLYIYLNDVAERFSNQFREYSQVIIEFLSLIKFSAWESTTNLFRALLLSLTGTSMDTVHHEFKINFGGP